MPTKNYRFQNAVLVGSFVVLITISLFFRFKDNPPNVLSIFSNQKPGIMSINGPDWASINSPFTVEVEIDTKSQNVNATGIYLNFNPQTMHLVNLDTSQSFCQFYPEKRFDNTLGTISLSCGSPHPGVSGKNVVLTLEFLPILSGSATIITDPKSKLLLSNGKGTNVLQEYPQKKIQIRSDI